LECGSLLPLFSSKLACGFPGRPASWPEESGSKLPHSRKEFRGSRMVPLAHVLALSVTLFVIGAAGFVFRKNIITVFMSIEIMLNAVNLAFIGFSRYLGNLDGQLFVFFVIVVAAAEATVGLAVIIAVYRNRDSLNIDDIDTMKL
jgi:NADH-quinone oxidoreductase subunit K